MVNETTGGEPTGPKEPDPEFWNLRLYVAGQTVKCVAAVRNLNKFCEEHLAGRYHIEVIDLMHRPMPPG